MPYMMHGYHWLWTVVWLGLWALVILGIFFVVRALACRKTECKMGEKSALDILNERYARGEITREEYNEKRNDILGK